jgi:hypothetical protein
MNRLQKFVEQDPYREKSGRTAYAFGPDKLPEATNGLQWKPVISFRAADELMQNAGLKEVFKAALANGVAVVSKEIEGDERG